MKVLILSALLVVSLLRPAECQLVSGLAGGLTGGASPVSGLTGGLGGALPVNALNLDQLTSKLGETLDLPAVLQQLGLTNVQGLATLLPMNGAQLKNFAATNNLSPDVVQQLVAKVQAALGAGAVPGALPAGGKLSLL